MMIAHRQIALLLVLILSVLSQPLHAAADYDLCQQDDWAAKVVAEHGGDALDIDNDHAASCCGAGCSVLFADVVAVSPQTPSSEYNEIRNYYSYLRLPRLDRPPA